MMDTKEKLAELIHTAFYKCYSTECPECSEYDELENESTCACQPRLFAAYLIDNGVTVKAKKEKPPVDLTGKCGSCVWAVKDVGTFGKSLAYVRCTNSERFGNRRYREHPLTAVRQRTAKACKKYTPQQPAEEQK